MTQSDGPLPNPTVNSNNTAPFHPKASRPWHHDRRCLVVMYHYVHDADPLGRRERPQESAGAVGLTSQAFRTQLDFLTGIMEPIDWPTLYAGLCDRRPLPDHCFLLTFDDGLADHAQVVLPILQERGMRAVFFIPGTVLTTRRLLSAHAVHLLLSLLTAETLQRELLELLEADEHFEDVPPNSGDRPCGHDRARSPVCPTCARTMYPYESSQRAQLKYLLTATLPIETRDAAVRALFERHIGSGDQWARKWYLDWEDLVRMQSLGHTIGAHGFRHEPYSRLTLTQQQRDLQRVQAVLRQGLGPDVRPLSYPYGAYNDDTCAACERVGFVHAFTTKRAWITSKSNRFRLPRVDTIHVETLIEREFPCLQA